MSKTATCLYGTDAQAANIVNRLENAGISGSRICLFTAKENNRYWKDTDHLYEGARGTVSDKIVSYLTSNGVPDSDAHAYAEGVRRGNALVAVRCEDNEADRVIDILDDEGVLDIDERQRAWQAEGWSGYRSGMIGTADAATTARGASASVPDVKARRGAGERDEVIPVAEEELHVGKRDVTHGRVRVTSHVVERPVQEQVSLNEEHVEVERRPVEGTRRTAGDRGDLFRERTIEAEEHTEEPVISKEARVKEEVVLHKDVERRTETVSDKVRRTEVEVEDDSVKHGGRTGTTGDKR